MHDGGTLITGAGGFIGARLVERLLANDEPLHAIVRPSTPLDRLRSFGDRLHIHRVDLNDGDGVRRCIRAIAPRRVFHLAADTGQRTHQVAERGSPSAAAALFLAPPVNVVEALADLKIPPEVLVRAGTIAEYGRSSVSSLEQDVPAPDTAYGSGMLATTVHLAAMALHLPFPIITARLALCYGPGQGRSFLIASLIDACLSRRAITVRRPMDRRDLLHVDDAVDGLLSIARIVPRGHGIINISTGTAPNMDEVASLIETLTCCPAGIVYRKAAPQSDRLDELRSNPSLARKLLGWESRSDLVEGLTQTVAVEKQMRMEAD